MDKEALHEIPQSGNQNGNMKFICVPKGDIPFCPYYYAYVDRQN
jgi:hypothetical protein